MCLVVELIKWPHWQHLQNKLVVVWANGIQDEPSYTIQIPPKHRVLTIQIRKWNSRNSCVCVCVSLSPPREKRNTNNNSQHETGFFFYRTNVKINPWKVHQMPHDFDKRCAFALYICTSRTKNSGAKMLRILSMAISSSHPEMGSQINLFQLNKASQKKINKLQSKYFCPKHTESISTGFWWSTVVQRQAHHDQENLKCPYVRWFTELERIRLSEHIINFVNMLRSFRPRTLQTIKSKDQNCMPLPMLGGTSILWLMFAYGLCCFDNFRKVVQTCLSFHSLWHS